MGERPVADIMEEGRGNNERALVFGELEPAARDIRKEHSAKGVFKPRMVGARIYEVGKTELPDVAEALQHGGVEQPEREIFHLDITMDRVLDDL